MTKKILFEDALILNATRAFTALVRVLPPAVALGLGRAIGDAIFFFSARRRVAVKNLRAAFAAEKSPEEIDRLACDSFRNMAMSAVELLRFPLIGKAWLESHVDVIGAEKFRPYLAEGRGVIFLTGHFGNWELLNIAGSLLGHPIAALVRRQKHPRSDDYLNRLRASKGTEIIHKGMMLRQLIRALRASKIIGILSDQDGGRSGAKVRFFGRRSSTPRGAAAFARRTGAPIFPVFIFREAGGRHRIEVEETLSGRTEDEILQNFSEILESKIRRDPGQWLWAHRRWKSAPERRVLILNDSKPGHLNQSLGFVEALRQARRVGEEDLSGFVEFVVLEPEYRTGPRKKILQAAVFLFGKEAPFRRRLLRAALTQKSYEELMTQAPDIVVSCGSRHAAVNLLAAGENFARSAVILKPLEPLRFFDAAIVPRHDKIAPTGNIFVTETAPSPIKREEVAAAGRRLMLELPAVSGCRGPRVGLLVGGDVEGVVFDREIFEKVLQAVLRYRAEEKGVLLATTSRRTPGWAEALLKIRLSDMAACPLLVIANEANRADIVAGILGSADRVVVSGESMSMVSEAVLSGKPVSVFIPSANHSLKPRHRAFLEGLEKRRLIVIVDPGTIYQNLKSQAASANGALVSVLESDRQALAAAAQKLLG